MKNVYKLLVGRIFTNVGDSIILITLTWYIAKNYDSSIFLGVLTALIGVIEACIIFVGPIIDRYNVKKILIFSTLIQILLISILYFLLELEMLNILSIYIILTLSVLFSSIIYPTESALIPKLVNSKSQIARSNSLFQITYKGMDIVLDGLVGLLLSYLLLKNFLLINIIIFLLALFAFKMLKLPSKQITNEVTNTNHSPFFKTYMYDLKKGLKFISQKTILKLLIPLSIINLVITMISVVYPKISLNFGDNSYYYGLILFSNGIGIMIGLFISPKIINLFNFRNILCMSFATIASCWLLILLILDNYFYIFLALLLIVNVIIGVINLSFITAFQVIPPKDLLGRVNTTNETLLSCLIPFGGLIGGILPDIYSDFKINFFLAFIICICISLFYYFDKDIKKIEKIENIERNDINV